MRLETLHVNSSLSTPPPPYLDQCSLFISMHITLSRSLLLCSPATVAAVLVLFNIFSLSGSGADSTVSTCVTSNGDSFFKGLEIAVGLPLLVFVLTCVPWITPSFPSISFVTWPNLHWDQAKTSASSGRVTVLPLQIDLRPFPCTDKFWCSRTSSRHSFLQHFQKWFKRFDIYCSLHINTSASLLSSLQFVSSLSGMDSNRLPIIKWDGVKGSSISTGYT